MHAMWMNWLELRKLFWIIIAFNTYLWSAMVLPTDEDAASSTGALVPVVIWIFATRPLAPPKKTDPPLTVPV